MSSARLSCQPGTQGPNAFSKKYIPIQNRPGRLLAPENSNNAWFQAVDTLFFVMRVVLTAPSTLTRDFKKTVRIMGLY
jgi:hypothetical protein